MRTWYASYDRRKNIRCALPHLLTTESYAFKELNKNVIQKAIDEINLKIENMDLQMNIGKRGRSVVHIEIYNNYYPMKRNSSSGDIPLFNWLEEN